MDIMQLQYFLTVAKYNHMTLAADHLYLSQSALSKHISQLETEIGLKLFDRSARTIHLSSAGHAFIPFARAMVDQHAAMQQKMAQYQQPNQGSLRLGAIPSISQYQIHHALLAFEREYPGITLQLCEKKGHDLIKLLDDDHLDMAIVRTATLPNNAYKTIPLISDSLALVLPSAHPLAKEPAVALKAAAGEPFILLDSGPGLPEICLSACRNAGFAPAIRHRFSHLETILGFVAAQAGVSLLMEKTVSSFAAPGIKCLPLQDPVTSTVALVFPHGKQLSPSANLLRNFLANGFRPDEAAEPR